MTYRIVDLDLDAPPTRTVVAGCDGIAVVSRRAGRVVGFALHEGVAADLAADELLALADTEPVVDPPLRADPERPVPTVTAAICTHDRPDLLDACLGSLMTQKDPPDEILVIDNAPSDDRTAEVVARRVADLSGIRRVIEPCPGLDVARNTALRRARGEVVAFVDDDVLVDPHWCATIRAVFQREPGLDAVTGQILPAELDTPAQVAFERRGGFRGGNEAMRWHGQDLPGDRHYPYHPGRFGAGANMAVRRTSAHRIGGFDDALDTGTPMPGGGDLDLFHRVIRSGGTLGYEPQIVVFHRHRRSDAELRAQYRSWGLTFLAWMSKTYRADPAGRPKLRAVARYFFRTQVRDLRRAPHADLRRAAAAELRGATGIITDPYLRSRRRTARRRAEHGRPRVALLPWGDVIDDYLHPIGLTTDDLVERLDGGWLFGYVEALDRADVDVVVVCWSGEVRRPSRRVHVPTGTTVWLLPQPRLHRLLRTMVDEPYAHGGRAAAGARVGLDARRARAVRHLLPYAATGPRMLRRILRREAITSVLCQEYEEGRFDVCVALGRLLGVPVVATFQGGAATRSRLERVVRPRSIGRAAGVIIGPDDEAERVRTRYEIAPSRIHRIPNPFDPRTVPVVGRGEARRFFSIEDGTVVAVWHGRIDPVPKGIDTLVDAWAQVVRRSSDDVRLLMMGTGPGAPWLHERLARPDASSIEWRDEYVLDRRDIGRLLAAGDLYVFPSRHEGFPVAPLEAMGAGLPVVACDAPGIRRIVGQGSHAAGYVVAIGDHDALADRIVQLVGDAAARSRLAAVARRRVDEEFGLDAAGRDLRDALLPR